MFIEPNWPAPSHIKAFTTVRSGGVSQPPFDHFNLANHVGDFCEHVNTNRALLKKQLRLPAEPTWIQQTHSTIAIKASLENVEKEADAAYTDQPNQICIVLTADCLPILLTNKQGTHVAAIHAGWRGLANGIIEATLANLAMPREDLLVWLGPAIGPLNFEVGDEVRNQFITMQPQAESAFLPSPNKRWYANLYELATLRLHAQGINSIFGGEYCTYADAQLFYSYRRDSGKTGRMATLIWINS